MVLVNRKDIIAIGILFFLIIIFWFDIIFLGRTLFAGDLRHQHSHLQFFHHNLNKGKMPFWNPYILSGIPSFVVGPSLFFYPIAIIFYFFLPKLVAFNFLHIFHIFLNGCFMYLFAREIELKPLGALISSIIFMFNGYVF
jgi:uncharacterized membrane protein